MCKQSYPTLAHKKHLHYRLVKTLYVLCNVGLCLEFWPRLIVDEQKPAWLKINFDRWQSEDASDSENEEQEQQAKLEVNIFTRTY